ncbi:DUF1624 domain-containing protein [Mucilaginibacter arboris]|uniref:DUF1624 domain-containing protein n=1 Tax=Mucilaginibacter arboris TaxID=2682090 RepID=A0A7K1STU5_9SPHI|nr:heparan-alpha-glucosaminide N-acetyltransferase domain-containing protein [Mucilaginibacter arboris]MVN20749.1 DUF1624 domain-containing protein [Mucilaginibacter arboris]
MKRIYSIDVTRGLVMVIMALDHTRDLLHVDSVAHSPTDLNTTTPILFFTRWITYLCAPIFVFLAGTSAYLSLRRKNDIAQSRDFLLKRGAWLIVLEFTVVNLGLFFDPGFHLVLFEVIATIGFGFIILSMLLKISPIMLATIGLIIISSHELFTAIPFAQGSLASKILSPLFTLTPLPLFPGHLMLVAYPPIPWLGIMLTGFGAGRLFELSEERRKSLFLRIGLVSLVLFAVIRLINKYGDPVPWSFQKSPAYTFLSIMNISKYPPSLLFTLVTLGIMFLILGTAEGQKNKITDIACVYGKVPLFYFILHFYVIHTLLLIILFAQGFHWADMSFTTGTFGRPKGAECGVPLWAVYLIWLGVVAVLYKPCIWFGKYKAKYNSWWIRYL